MNGTMETVFVGVAIKCYLFNYILIFENKSSKAEQKRTVARYKTCYTNSTEGIVHGSIWKNQQPTVFLHDAKMINIG